MTRHITEQGYFERAGRALQMNLRLTTGKVFAEISPNGELTVEVRFAGGHTITANTFADARLRSENYLQAFKALSGKYP